MEKYFDLAYIVESVPMLVPFLKVTLIVTSLSVLFGTIIGFILAVMKLGNSKIARKLPMDIQRY